MALAHALAPEGVIAAAGEDRVGIQSLQREHAGIPAGGNHRYLAALLRGGIHGSKVLGNAGMGVKRIDDVKEPGIGRGLLRQIGGAAAAEHEHVQFVFVLLNLADAHHPGAAGVNRGGVASREHCDKFHILRGIDRNLYAAAQIAVTENSDFQSHDAYLIKI